MYRKSVFIVVYRIENNKPSYLLLKRHKHWKGWEFPKGGYEKKENSLDVVKREVYEETNNKPQNIIKHPFSGRYEYQKCLKDRPNIVGQTFSLYSAEIKSKKIEFDEWEHLDFCWCSLKEAIKLLKWENQKEGIMIVNDFLTKKLNKLKIRKATKKDFNSISELIYSSLDNIKNISKKDISYLKKFYFPEKLINLSKKSNAGGNAMI